MMYAINNTVNALLVLHKLLNLKGKTLEIGAISLVIAMVILLFVLPTNSVKK